jgi:hypothetical protein
VVDFRGYEEEASWGDFGIIAARAEASATSEDIVEFVLMMRDLRVD